MTAAPLVPSRDTAPGRPARVALALGALACLCFTVAWATPFVPTDDAQVLERLRIKPLDAQAREMRQWRAQLARQPDDLQLATRLARRYIAQGRAEFEPRYYGRAQAVLHPWWHMSQPPQVIAVLRAMIRQSQHDFAGALADLTLALQLDPQDPQAYVSRAMVLQARGQYAEATRSCLSLLRLSTQLVAVTCLSSVASLHGQAAESYRLLQRVLRHTTDATPRDQLWALTVLADIAARTGQEQRAETHFMQAQALGLQDSFLVSLYANFLLDAGRFAEVVELLRHRTRSDTLLLQLALAEQAMALPSLAEHVRALRARFAASRLRQDSRHLREEARFTLHLLQQPGAALQLAQANWAVQREPEDARIVLQAALAAHQHPAAQPVLDWLQKRQLEDVHLDRLRRQLQEPHP